jgi:exodeoxyribonuclease-3
MSWNVNGIRACQRGGFLDWFAKQDADMVCIQETKARAEQLEDELLRPLGYHGYWHSAEKKGYSGVATFTRRRPREVREGLGVRAFDREGRVLETEFPGFVLINAYYPNSQRDHARLPYKLRFCRAMRRRVDALVADGKNVIVCGDHNIAHRDIDLANPSGNRRNAGFLPQERGWLERTLRAGYLDAFRHLCDEPDHYTWWSYRPGVREKNVGWRIDLFMINEALGRRLRRAYHQPDVRGSDHCPIGLELR